MHMAFLSRVFKNLQWYGMTVKKPVTAMVTGSFLALLQGVFPLVFPLQVKKGV